MPEVQVRANIPRDLDDVPIPVLSPGSLTNAAVTVSSLASAIPSGAEIVEIASSTDCYILFTTSGGSVTSSTGQVFPKGVNNYRVPAGATHVAHIRDSADGRISITRLI